MVQSSVDGSWSGGTTVSEVVTCRVEFQSTNTIYFNKIEDGTQVKVRYVIYCQKLTYQIPTNSDVTIDSESRKVALHKNYQTHSEIWVL